MKTVTTALDLAASGYHVFPVIENGKVPSIEFWPQKATTDPDRIKTLWGEKNFNIGIAGGSPYQNGYLFILDVDVAKSKTGLESRDTLVDLYGDLPSTYMVKTPTGGLHYYFTSPHPVATTAGKLGQGLDTRGQGGYVVGPSSTIDAEPYTVIDASPVAPAPQWLIDLIGKPKERKSGQVITLLDLPANVDRAKDYLLNTAPEAVEHHGGNYQTYKVAAAIGKFGVSQLTALELMAEHWNPIKAKPSWDYEDLARIVSNAYTYRQEPLGDGTPQADFQPVAGIPTADLMPTLKERPPYTLVQAIQPDESSLPKRPWILGRQLLRQKVTVLIAPPGVGKSTASIAWALSVITGRNVFGLQVHETGNAAIINNEDDLDEMSRRLAATLRHHSIPWSEVQGKLFIQSGETNPFIIAKRSDNDKVKPFHKEDIINYAKENKIKLLIADPFLETHEADENDNRQISEVARMYREIAQRADCAVLLVHHTRKPSGTTSESHAGNMDSGRGASSLIGVARIVVTLYDMSKKDAEKYGIVDDNRHLYVRLDDAKANLSLKSNKAHWYEKKTITLLNGDDVGVLEAVELKEPEVATEEDLMDAFTNWDSFKELRDKTWLPVKAAARILLDGSCLAVMGMSVDGLARKLERDFQGDGVSNGTIEVRHEKHVGEGKTRSLLYCKVLT